MKGHRIFTMPVASVYPLYLRKAESKGRTKDEVDQVIWEMIGDAITDAVQKYITQDYVAANIAEWARVNFGVSLEAEDLRGMRSLHDLEDYIKAQARVDGSTSLPLDRRGGARGHGGRGKASQSPPSHTAPRRREPRHRGSLHSVSSEASSCSRCSCRSRGTCSTSRS